MHAHTRTQELRSAQQRCEQAESELAVLRSRGAGGWTPEAAAFMAMERRLDEMAREMVRGQQPAARAARLGSPQSYGPAMWRQALDWEWCRVCVCVLDVEQQVVWG